PRAQGAPRALPRQGLAGAALVGVVRPRLQPLVGPRRRARRRGLLAWRRALPAGGVLRVHLAEAGRDRGRGAGLERRTGRVPAPVRNRAHRGRPARCPARVPRLDLRGSPFRRTPHRLAFSIPLRRDVTLNALAAAALAAALAWLGPPGADLAAHVFQR